MTGTILTSIDLAIIVGFLAITVALGIWVSARAAKDTRSYFLGGNKMPWYVLGLSNASGQFDIGGTMWMVSLLVIYGLKSVYIPWLWPVFNQIFLMVFLSAWLRRSGVMTGAEWINFRFGNGTGATLSHIIIVVFALLVVLGYLAYSFVGIGKFAAEFIPYQISADPLTNERIYGLGIVFLTSLYVVKGGMYSVVLTELLQFVCMVVASVAIGIVAMQAVAPGELEALVPAGWFSLGIEWNLSLDWGGTLIAADDRISSEGWEMFGIFLGLVFFQGILKSMAGPAPNYDMQRILSAKSPREASLMSAVVNVVLLFPRYMMIAGLVALALKFYMTDLQAAGANADFDRILPFVINNFLPVGLTGLVIAGLIAAFMSSFAAVTNAAPAYVVNDIIKKYFRPDADQKFYVRISIITAAIFVILGTLLGLVVPTLNQVIIWITSALYGGYAVSNVLKWYWWRFNGFGYFYGMLAGILSALPFLFIELSPVLAFPVILVFCLIGCVFGSLKTEPTDMETLKAFYVRTRPWGAWGPVHEAALLDNPDLGPNKDMLRDLANVGVGIVWQTALIAAPIFLVLHRYNEMAVAFVVIALTSIFLKFNWLDRIKNYAEDYDITNSDKERNSQNPVSSQ